MASTANIPLQRNKNQESRLAEKALADLEELIVTLELAPGSYWTEESLSERLGIGRTPVREAVQILATNELLIPIRRHGIMVSRIDVRDQLLVIETRRELERLITMRAARRATYQERDELVEVARSIESEGQRGDVISFLRHHFAAKKLTAKYARNPFAARAIAPLHTFSRRFYYRYHEQLDDLPVVASLHADVARAVAAGLADAAGAASDRMLDYAEAFTLKIIQDKL